MSLNRNEEALLLQLPKVDLHLHLDGCVKPGTLLELANEQGVSLPAADPEGLLPYMQVDDDCDSLVTYLSKFDFVLPLLQTPEALERVAYEVVEQCAEQNCKYVEVRFGPQLHRIGGLSASEVIAHVIKGLQRGEKDFGVIAQAIAICMRHQGIQENLEVIEAASQFTGKGLAAVDLAGDEANYPAELFRQVFELAQERGIPVTIHAGEAAGPGNIQEAITKLGATRIGHGVRMRESAEVMELVRRQGIVLEMCPISNIQTKAVSSWDAYPIRDYYDQGYLITVNTDNPTVSGTTITKEYHVLMEKFNFTLQEIAAIILNGVDAALLDEQRKQAMRQEFQRKFAELEI
ncbi:adenosine deaminase [Paenibacillus abyssi]|uniref:Adenosine deaminase n=1 Tax=Paenibacillus abyssi TaxID=1340531 RepID=A0A917CQ94_9BACL|nr:adenosine deaminase [Paenibacillus abyssi]GGF92779.1 adenosine deaminase [Paenibacillus abyssi]